MQQSTANQNDKFPEEFLWIPTKENSTANHILNDKKPFSEEGYMSKQDVVNLLRKYKNNPDAIQYIADMMED
jgi:hypothetical protein